MTHLSAIPAFGFETIHNHFDHKEPKNWKQNDNKFYIESNGEKIMGYIPILGTLMGLIRLADIADGDFNPPNKAFWILRSFVELFSIGFLLIIPDLIFTFNREWANKRNLAPTCYHTQTVQRVVG